MARATRRDRRIVARELAAATRSRQQRMIRGVLGIPVVVITMAAMIAAMLVPLANRLDQGADWVDTNFFAFPRLPDDLALAAPASRSTVLAADGTLLATLHGPENREPVALDEVPQVLRHAVVATEDQHFWEHTGVDHRAIVRATFENLAAGGIEQGGSTITQQLVKNLTEDGESSIYRKVREAVHATTVEQRFTKEEILEAYLNFAYFGNGAYGVAAASEFYFGHTVSEVTLAEAALLAGLIRTPAANDPIDHPDEARQRRNIVIDQMVGQGMLDWLPAQDIKHEPVVLRITPTNVEGVQPFVVEYAKRLLFEDDRLGENREERIRAVFSGGLQITTTLDPHLQSLADESIATFLTDPASDPLGALITIAPGTGRIRAMAVGPKQFGVCSDGADCSYTKVNPLVPGGGGSGRQPGSAFKPFVLAAALDAGLSPSWSASTTSGSPIYGCLNGDGSTWRPRNYSGGSQGVLNMYSAIQKSNNVFHAKLGAAIGAGRVADMATRLGITTDVPRVCANALGAASVFPLDMATAYATFASGGARCEPHLIAEVRDREGNLLLANEPNCEQVLNKNVAALIADMLTGVVEGGTGRAAQLDGRPVAGKTGTTNDFRDAWFIGFTPQIVTAAWVGFEQPRSMEGILGYTRVTGGTVPAQMWRAYMEPALANWPIVPFAVPE